MFFQQINIFIIWTVYFANIKDTFRIVIHVLLKSEQKKNSEQQNKLLDFTRNMDGNNPKVNIYIIYSSTTNKILLH